MVPRNATPRGKARLQLCHANALIDDAAKLFAKLDRLKTRDFLLKGRKQPVTPRREIFD
jgi:hypothetical protein